MTKVPMSVTTYTGKSKGLTRSQRRHGRYKHKRHFDAMVREIRSESKAYAQDFARDVVKEARRRAPVGKLVYTDRQGHQHPGYLRKSISAEHIGEGQWLVTVGAFYGVYVENGTRYMRAQPFLKPAVEATKAVYRHEWGARFSRMHDRAIAQT